MKLIPDHRMELTRSNERARFERWFVPTAFGRAYIDRQGRARGISEDEYLAWQDQAYDHVEDMVGKIQPRAMAMVAVMLVTIAAAYWVAGQIGFTGTARSVLISVAVLIVEVGLLGIDVYDYWLGWKQQRDEIEAAVAGRAPLPVDPERARIPHNWYMTAQYAIAGFLLALYFSSHVNDQWIERIDWRWVFALVPIAWVLHFAGRRHDRAAQDRLRY